MKCLSLPTPKFSRLLPIFNLTLLLLVVCTAHSTGSQPDTAPTISVTHTTGSGSSIDVGDTVVVSFSGSPTFYTGDKIRLWITDGANDLHKDVAVTAGTYSYAIRLNGTDFLGNSLNASGLSVEAQLINASYSVKEFDASTDVTTASNTIAITSHSFETLDSVLY